MDTQTGTGTGTGTEAGTGMDTTTEPKTKPGIGKGKNKGAAEAGNNGDMRDPRGTGDTSQLGIMGRRRQEIQTGQDRKTDQRRMPGKGSKKMKGKKSGKRPSTTRTARPSVILASLHTSTTGDVATGQFGGVPQVWSKVGLCGVLQTPAGPQPDWHAEVDSTGSYDHYMDFHKGYTDYGEYRECCDVSLRSDLGFDYGEDPSMEVEEVFYGDPPNGRATSPRHFRYRPRLRLGGATRERANHPKRHKEG
ncbi:hypothetical protein P4O66_015370 [Electrophorus voltai]|uniref:Uncharacterized protein n=1 Tax=Electrophorus voltai TaxID=2609070 RepID=A0AAD8YZ45_9TELE|nr:hypothetical protein P4O66_015370 [Electrophorus voltai]